MYTTTAMPTDSHSSNKLHTLVASSDEVRFWFVARVINGKVGEEEDK
jgi:hypothetical protein